ncbi:hypothetical protein EOPP23_03945 [Endozoicomonas sp. OPT23]|uniref:DUF3426 domain-containing protein n=1 Tax=Endozoicomonas sp. OPT23 TaxID=2072845 RepID=UPI00129A7AF3|nr:DUF3426 domain-containing protein [Endozoicomonas sp. OPT23]MRI32147.1 hypothetical protein [Endozoicomonas sp. OPT23]
MTSPQLTQCPKCQTSFRVTSTQLRAAAGSVRCGSCLEVFDARDHMVKSEAEAATEKTKQQQSEVITETSVELPETSPEPASETRLKREMSSVTKPETDNQHALEDIKTTIKLPDAPQHNLDSIFSHLETEGLEATEEKEHRPKARIAALVAVVTIGFLGLATQYVWFNKDQLATNLKLRPAYTFACQLLDCKLPTLKNLQAIKSMQLLVRSMPERPEGLVVDSIIINEAPFSQPWPKLNLTFSNINGQVVASRTFRPSEYLGGALADSSEIPSGKPVRLSLEIVDPGQGAVNYQLNLL